MPSDRRFWIALAAIALVFLTQALVLARTLVPSHDESSALFLARLAAGGQISLFGDGMVGHRPFGPAYIFGATQVVFGPSLIAARLLGVAFGLVLVVLTALLGRRLGGSPCGLLAAALLAAQGAVVGYYALGDWHSLVPTLVVTALSVWVWRDTPARNVGGMALFASLFFFRSHVMPLIPFAFAYALWRARSGAERLLVAGVTFGPVLLFFASDERHLKLLAHMPLVSRLVRPLGYVPFVFLDARPQQDFWGQIARLLDLARRYEFLILATLVALVLLVTRARRDAGFRAHLRRSPVRLVAALFLWGLGALFVVYRINFKWIGMYFASLVPLLAIALAYVYGRVLTDRGVGRASRAALAAFLAAILVLPVYYNRNPLLPIGEARAADSFRMVHVAAAHLARVVPRDAKIFFFGPVDVYYLAGLPATYLPQIVNYDTLAVRDEDNWATLRSGYYGMPQVERWLGVEAAWAVISPQALETFATGFHGHPDANVPKVQRIRALLARHFEKIATVSEYPAYSYEVYRRVSGPGR